MTSLYNIISVVITLCATTAGAGLFISLYEIVLVIEEGSLKFSNTSLLFVL